MAFFATVWWIVGLRAAGHGPAVLYPVPVVVAALAGLFWYITRRRQRTHSLFRQGQEYYMLIPNMKENESVALATRFGEMVAEQRMCRDAFGIL